MNTAPTLDINQSPALSAAFEGATTPIGTLVSALVAGATDADGQSPGVAVTALDITLGTWQFSTDGGVTWLIIDAASINSATNELALLLAPDAVIRLLPFGNLHGSIAEAITFRAWDQTSGSSGDYVAIGDSGGATAFSAQTDTAALQIAPVNNAPTFSPAVGTGTVVKPMGWGNSVLVQPDGKIVAVGYAEVGWSWNALALRYDADGAPDTSFNETGQVLLGEGSAYKVVLQPDGKLLLSGHGVLVRLNADGSIDNSFTSTATSAHSVALQPDGKILLAGNSGDGNFTVTRLNEDGSADTTFNGTGTSVVVSDPYESIVAIHVQADGKILISGISGERFAAARLNQDGTLDTSYADTGIATYNYSLGSDSYAQATTLEASALQADGKLVLVGTTNDLSPIVMRLDADGTLDTSFAETGMLMLRAFDVLLGGVTVQADGKILITGNHWLYGDGSSLRDVLLIRLNADGTLDDTFNGSGSVILSVGDFGVDDGRSVTVQPDGKIVVTGRMEADENNESQSLFVTRLNADGTLDTTFGGTAANTLGGTFAYTEGDASIALDASVSVYDADLATIGNYAGASITLARHSGASADDVFAARGDLAFTSGDAVLSGVIIGAVTNVGGTLTITFNANATQALVNDALSSIAYSNTSDNPPASVLIDWTFSDGNAGQQGADGALSITGSTTVNITAINDAPVLTGDRAATVNEGGSYTLTTADLDCIDADDEASGLSFTVASLVNGSIKVGGIVASTFTGTQLAAGQVAFEHDGSETTAASFEVAVEDGDEDGSTPTPSSFNLTVAPVNQAPVLTGDRIATVAEGASYTLTTADLDFTDVDDTAGGVSFTVSSLVNGSIKVNGSTTTSFTGTQLAAGQVAFQHDGSEAAAASFNVVVEDGNEDSSTPTASAFSLTVTPVNDAPVLTGDRAAVVNEGASYTLTTADLNYTDADDTAAGVSFTVASLVNGTIKVNGSTATSFTGTQLAAGQVAFEHDGSETTAASFDVTVEDGDEDSSTPTASAFSLTVTPVTDAPQSTDDAASVTEDVATVLGSSDFGVFSDVDAGDSLKAVRIVSLPVNGSLTLNNVAVSAGQIVSAADIASNLLVFTPLGNDDTDESLTFKVIDQGNAESATHTLTLDITPVNDEPTGSVSISGAALSGNVLTASNTLADVEGIPGGVVSYQWKSNGTAIEGATAGTFTITNAQVGTIISVTASYVDGGGTLEDATGSMTSVVGSVIITVPDATTVVGTPGDDVLTPGTRPTTMTGGAGDDTYITPRGRDTVVELGGGGTDTVVSQGTFTLGANVENLTLAGTRSANGTGNELDNVIIGNSAKNALTGLGGADTLTGGAGADRFVFSSVAHSTAADFDTITDFNVLQRDVLDLKGIDANALRDGNQKFVFIGTAEFADHAGVAGLLRFDAGTHMLEANVDGDTDAEFAILLVGVNSITAQNIVL